MTAPLPDLERVYNVAIAAARCEEMLFVGDHNPHRAGLLAVYRAGQDAAEIAARLDS